MDVTSRYRINHHLVSRSRRTGNHLYRRFKPYFEFLLSRQNPAIERKEGHLWYVSNPSVEKELESLSFGGTDTIVFFVGTTGIGKSTYIRYVFGVDQNPRLDKDKKSLLIPFHLDGTALVDPDDIKDLIIGKINAAIATCIDEYGLEITDVDLGEFISQHRKDLIYSDLEVSDDASMELRVKNFRQRKRRAYLAEKLKYMVAITPHIEEVVIIVDDIESSPYSVQRTLMEYMLHFQHCLENTTGIPRNFNVVVLISCRPMTERLFRDEPDFQSYPMGETLGVDEPVNLQELLDARFDTSIKLLGEGVLTRGRKGKVSNLSEWKNAKKVLDIICSNIVIKHGDTIVSLHNNNYRESFDQLISILTNSRWFQKYEFESNTGGFDIDSDHYRINDAGIIRAIGLREGTVFDGESTCVVNLFHNTPDQNSDLLLTYLVRYFIFYRNYVESRLNIVKFENLLEDFRSIFDDRENLDGIIREIVDFARNRKLVEIQNRYSDGGYIEHICALPRLVTIWELLGSRAMYLELCRDDTFVPRRCIEKYGQVKPTSEIWGDKLFLALCDFTYEISEIELYNLEFCKKRKRTQLYIKFFGSGLLTEQVYDGLQTSIHNYYLPSSIPSSVHEAVQAIRDKIDRLRNLTQVSTGGC